MWEHTLFNKNPCCSIHMRRHTKEKGYQDIAERFSTQRGQGKQTTRDSIAEVSYVCNSKCTLLLPLQDDAILAGLHFFLFPIDILLFYWHLHKMTCLMVHICLPCLTSFRSAISFTIC